MQECIEPMRTPKTISLYTGAGGLDYGFEAAGFETAVAIELDPTCVKTLMHNRSWPVICAPIESVPTSAILEKASAEMIDVLVGGPPCQPFSKSGFWASGETKRLDDPRASTLESFLRVLEETRPRAFLMENVEGLGFAGKDDGLRYIEQRLQQINVRQETNYRLRTAVLNAADYGVPQIRRRFFLIAARDGTPFGFPARTHHPPQRGTCDARAPYRTAWDALYNVSVSPSDGDLRVRGKWAELLPTIPEGQNYLWHTPRGGGEPLFGWRRRYWSFLLKLAKDLPSWTIQAQPGPATGPFHWSNRRLSAREMARLQTFPADVEIVGGYGDVQRQLGNAVPSLVAEVLAREISGQLLARPVNGPLRLAIDAAPLPPPKPEMPKPVPQRYLSLRGSHEAHPGTGKGFRAISRSTLLDSVP
jgi:DNA (cytosine-5)-methyltransferase 1